MWGVSLLLWLSQLKEDPWQAYFEVWQGITQKA